MPDQGNSCKTSPAGSGVWSYEGLRVGSSEPAGGCQPCSRDLPGQPGRWPPPLHQSPPARPCSRSVEGKEAASLPTPSEEHRVWGRRAKGPSDQVGGWVAGDAPGPGASLKPRAVPPARWHCQTPLPSCSKAVGLCRKAPFLSVPEDWALVLFKDRGVATGRSQPCVGGRPPPSPAAAPTDTPALTPQLCPRGSGQPLLAAAAACSVTQRAAAGGRAGGGTYSNRTTAKDCTRR